MILSKHFVNKIIKIKLGLKLIRLEFLSWIIKLHWLSLEINWQEIESKKATAQLNGLRDYPLINWNLSSRVKRNYKPITDGQKLSYKLLKFSIVNILIETSL